ncbi:MAG TPA: glycosyltransferase family 4 protein [Bryobacteraceae bacterium]|nr:glycosyltransferase family 4 protein [Bryobacteraceae bacterium]
MRIVHIDSGTEMRGGQWQVLRLIEGLQVRGHQNVLVAREQSPLFERARTLGFDAREFGLRPLRQAGKSADIIHAHDARAHTAAAVAAFSSHLVVSRRVAFAVQRNAFSRLKYARAARYIAVSEYVKQTLLAAEIAPERISIVYDGVPMLPPSQGSDILIPASADPGKGMDLALAGAQRAGLKPLVSRDLEIDLPRAGVFVYISESEGLGSAVLLAMSAGVPVIASQVGGLREIVQHERTGLLTENSEDSIASAIERLRRDRALAQRLAAEARSMVEQRFSIDRMVTDTLAVYEALGR